jgi:hypothetical protein
MDAEFPFARRLSDHCAVQTWAVKIRFGLHVDRYLQPMGAIAQAVEDNIILVSSTLLSMHPFDIELVLSHELAHLQQLARPGNDPEGALETEAWEAAWTWAAGKRYRIRGRGRGRLNALAIIQGGPKGHPHALPWYRSNPLEPIDGSSVIAVKDAMVTDVMTLEALLDAILANQGTTEILIVSHGSGAGLAIPVRPGARSGAEAQVILALAADRSREEVEYGTKIKTPIKSDKDVADLTMLTEDKVSTLRMKMNQVQKMNLKHAAFRACNMGINKDTMVAFRNFFGAASVSAPRLFDSYGKFAPAILGGLEDWAKAKRKKGYHISIDDDVAFGIKKTDNFIYTIEAAATSKDAFKDWVANHIADGAWGSEGVIYHGMVAEHAAPTEPIVYFVQDTEFKNQLVKV